MINYIKFVHRGVCFILFFLTWSPTSSQAEQFGLFTYQVVDGTAVITDYPNDEVGHVEIPAVIEGFAVTKVEALAFANVSGLSSVTIPSSITTIGERAFYQSNIQIVHLSGDPPALGSEAFSDTSRGFTIYVPDNNSGYSVPTWEGYPSVFGGQLGPITYRIVDNFVVIETIQSQIEELTIPPFIENKPVTLIDSGAFAGHANLTQVSLPDSVVTISSGAFRNCVSLESINLPSNLATIGSEAFFGCQSLTQISIPEAVETIERLAFSGCSALENLTFNSEITSIGDSAFFNCDALLSVELPSTVSSLGDGVFAGCKSLNTIAINEPNPQFTSVDGVLFNNSLSHLLQYPAGRQGCYIVPPTVTHLNKRAFFGCEDLTSIHLPDNIVEVGEFCFHSCKALTTLELPSTLNNIAESAFIFCEGLTSVLIPERVYHIGTFAFRGCINLQSLLFLGNTPWFSDIACVECAPNFTTYHLKGSYGFTTPQWESYPSIEIDLTNYPAAPWLLSHNFPFDTNLEDEPNEEGINFLTAYALNLNPRLPMQPQFPSGILTANTLSIKFFGDRPEITYLVEQSDSLQNWSSNGVIVSDPDSNGMRTAAVSRQSEKGFLRISILEQ